MDLRHLKYFVAVAEELSFTRAAERLHIAQPPLSQQIQALEQELGLQLFERTRRRVTLTSSGERFLVDARRTLHAAEEAIQGARRMARGEQGELRVGFTSSVPFTGLLPELLRRYRAAYPQVTVSLRELFTTDQFAALAERRLDVGLVRNDGLVRPAGISLRELRRDPLRLVLPARHPLSEAASVSLGDVRDEGFIMYPSDAGTGLGAQVRQLCAAAGFEPRLVQEAREATTQIGLVAAGLGVAVLPAPLECVRMAGVRYVPIDDPSAFVSLALAVMEDDNSPLVGNFVAMVKGK
ncbi:LysR substrate-binding domain-containing protein [Uliginosibacterium sp. sgz301328]|uniref:LysR substrate-binding domain-containing protein n=1 Tax=Uliginosibacterium sp. sgz301328 TaxID=3243764 RepID=UPI00359DC315